jgi:hypothetical protein
MKTLYKDILRYVILAFAGVFAYDVTYDVIEVAQQIVEGKVKATNGLYGLLGAVQASVISIVTFLLKWFFQTKAQ